MKENKKQNILQVAKKLFIENGYGNVTMQQIANQANVSRGGLYHHFNSISEIIDELIFSYTTEFDVMNSELKKENAMLWLVQILNNERSRFLQKDASFQSVIHDYMITLEKKEKLAKWQHFQNQIHDQIVAVLSLLVQEKYVTNVAKHIELIFASFSFYSRIGQFSENQYDFEVQEILFLINKYQL